MKNYLPVIVLLCSIVCLSSCSGDEVGPKDDALSSFDLQVISYFKEVALGFEFGGASEITRKWSGEMKIYVGGTPNETLRSELDGIINELNTLISDGFSLRIVDDRSQSNFYLFFGSGADYATEYPSQATYVTNNWGLFSVFWNGNNELISGHMYVDIERANPTEQRHLLREELTQSLGLARDSNLYPSSIFQSSWTTTTSYAAIDEELIRLLYHPTMTIGLNAAQVDPVLRTILKHN
jgi:hypothetical protein